MSEFAARMGRNGRVVIPAPLRKALGFEEGEELVIRRDGDAVKVLSRRQAVLDAQARVRRFVPEGESLADRLIADRRREADGDGP